VVRFCAIRLVLLSGVNPGVVPRKTEYPVTPRSSLAADQLRPTEFPVTVAAKLVGADGPVVSGGGE
jgi:hypothetical protein